MDMVTQNRLMKIDTLLGELDEHSMRYQALFAVRKFRTSWLELGRHLTEIAYGGDYKQWGFEDFETYVAQELGLKKPTVRKLMVSYQYMQKHANQIVADTDAAGEEQPPPHMPDYKTVEVLNNLRARVDVDQQEKDRFHNQAFDASINEDELRKEMRVRMATVDGNGIDSADVVATELKSVKRAAQALRRKISECRLVPEGMRERLERLLAEIEALD